MVVLNMLLEALVLALGFGSEKMKNTTSNYEYEKRQKEISKMDTWDCIEAQVREHFIGFMNYKAVPEYQNTIAYWENNRKGNYININLSNINENRRYLKSGLSMEEYVKKRFLERYKEHGKNLFNFNEFREITLYDENRNCYRFRAYFWRNSEEMEISYTDYHEQSGKFSISI